MAVDLAAARRVPSPAGDREDSDGSDVTPAGGMTRPMRASSAGRDACGRSVGNSENTKVPRAADPRHAFVADVAKSHVFVTSRVAITAVS